MRKQQGADCQPSDKITEQGGPAAQEEVACLVSLLSLPVELECYDRRGDMAVAEEPAACAVPASPAQGKNSTLSGGNTEPIPLQDKLF